VRRFEAADRYVDGRGHRVTEDVDLLVELDQVVVDVAEVARDLVRRPRELERAGGKPADEVALRRQDSPHPRNTVPHLEDVP
jgi:hypothetical protein